MAIAIKALESWLNKRTERFGRCRDHGFSRDKAGLSADMYRCAKDKAVRRLILALSQNVR